MRHLLLISLLSILAVLLPVAGVGADDGLVATETLLYPHQPSANCADRGGSLLPEPQPGSNCGYIYGAPAGEVEALTGQGLFENVRPYTTKAGTRIILDTSRTVEGVVVVSSRQSACASPAPPPVPCVPHNGVGSGAGEVVVDLRLAGRQVGGQTLTLGTTTVSAMVLPGTVAVELPYEMALPAGMDRIEFQSLTLELDVHGLHVNTGYADASGLTTLVVPSLVLPPVEGGGSDQG